MLVLRINGLVCFVELRVVVGRSRMRAGRPHAESNSHSPCQAHTALCRSLEKSPSERHGRGVARARLGMCEYNTAALC
jgi:hypothetical protein